MVQPKAESPTRTIRAKPRVASGVKKIHTDHHQILLDDCCNKVQIEMEDLPEELRDAVQEIIDYKVE